MTYLLANSMKQNQKQSSMQQPIFNATFYEGVGWAIGPNPPTPEAIEKAQFKDKTYRWNGR